MFLVYGYDNHAFTMDLSHLDAHDTWYLLDDFHEAFSPMKLSELPGRPLEPDRRHNNEWKRIFDRFGEPQILHNCTIKPEGPKGIHVQTVSGRDVDAYHEVQREMALGCLSTPSFEVLSEKRSYKEFIRGVFFRYYMNHIKHWIENEAHIYSVAVDGRVRGGCLVEEISRRTLSWRYSDLPHGETAVNGLSGVQDMQDFWNADQALNMVRTEHDVLKWQRLMNDDRPFWYLTGIHIGQGQFRGSRGLETALLRQIIRAKGVDSAIFVLCEHDNVGLYRSEGFVKVDYVQMRARRLRENTAKRAGDPNRTHLYTTLSGMWRPADRESSRCAVDRGEKPRLYRPGVAALFTGHASRFI
ncbi:hypothetical protein PFICI_02784 [Pestalotiopsis fici W106-1]|uniref:Uncharacterized protein n=1 Tax=Pestalotiopsis fici (strain W106-1 / CGMCC3.15140) TaxID=1229662 RepID=W3XFI6_PESFW|nr:uncharacterized protein PFICI_02784 [Pestalotiopsis fici W106-1]ETS84759.1 hypothetical protein PFICI_02784 [Pestalotiopsis fici W106-1]